MRLCIYNILDSTGVVDDYITYLLKNIRRQFDEIIVCAAQSTDKEALSQLQSVSDTVIKYDNLRYSGKTFLQKIGLEKMRQYENVTIMDSTLVGPFFGIDKMYEVMEYQNLDFWGMLRNYTRYRKRNVIEKEELLPHFVVINRSVLQSSVFETLVAHRNDGVELMKELIISLEYTGFNWDTYLETTLFKGKLPDENVDISIMYAYELLKYQESPFINWEALRNTYFLPGGDEVPYRVFEYIQKHTDYNIKLIWDYLLRTTNILDLKKALHLEYILSSEQRMNETTVLADKKIAVIAHLYYEDLVEDCFNYIEEIPSEIDVYIISSREETRSKIKKEIVARKLQNCRVLAKNNRGRDFTALLVTSQEVVRNYDYICFIHDKKSHSGSPVSSGKTWMYELWTCMLKNRNYILNILDFLKNNESLGMLVPPEPFHSEAIGGIGWTWAKNYTITQKLASRLSVNCILDPDKHPIALGTVFWCKREALAPLFDYDFKFEDFPDEPLPIDGTICHAMERILSYIPPTQGYYVAYVMNEEFAALRGTKLNTYMTDAMNVLRSENIWDRQDGGVIFNPNKRLSHFTDFKKLFKFCIRYRKIYIYGAGTYGQKCLEGLELVGFPVEAFIVTKKSGNLEMIQDIPVIELNEMTAKSNNMGIIIALKRKFREEVLPLLEDAGYKHIFCFPEDL